MMNVKVIYKTNGLDKSNNSFKMTLHGATHKKDLILCKGSRFKTVEKY